MDRLPDVFEVREDDRSYVLIDTIPSDLEEAVQRAVAVCPRAAISCIESN